MPVPSTSQLTSQRHIELTLPVRAWVRLMRVFHRIDRLSAERLRQWNVSVGRFDVINHAGIHEGATQQELAHALLVTKGNICQLLDSLERDNLLIRRKEGRTNRIYLTDAGRQLREAAMERHVREISRAMSPLDAEEQQTLLNLLRKIERGLDSQGAKSCAGPPTDT